MDGATGRREEFLTIFMEYVPGGSIASLLRRFGRFNETLVRLYTRQILTGLAYLHAHAVVHRDIKGGNVLVDRSGVCKLSDFGASTSLADLEHNSAAAAAAAAGPKSLAGTPAFMAPEVIKQTGYGRKSDIWSVGCTVIEMATGKSPWAHYDNPVAAMFAIAVANELPPLPSDLSADGADFLAACFRRDPAQRPTAAELLRHPFLALRKASDTASQPPRIASSRVATDDTAAAAATTTATTATTSPAAGTPAASRVPPRVAAGTTGSGSSATTAATTTSPGAALSPTAGDGSGSTKPRVAGANPFGRKRISADAGGGGGGGGGGVDGGSHYPHAGGGHSRHTSAPDALSSAAAAAVAGGGGVGGGAAGGSETSSTDTGPPPGTRRHGVSLSLNNVELLSTVNEASGGSDSLASGGGDGGGRQRQRRCAQRERGG